MRIEIKNAVRLESAMRQGMAPEGFVIRRPKIVGSWSNEFEDGHFVAAGGSLVRENDTVVRDHERHGCSR